MKLLKFRNFLVLIFTFFVSASLHSASTKQIDAIVKSLSNQLLKKLSDSEAAVAIMPFENSEGQVTQLGQLVSDGIAKEFVASKKLKVVERKNLDKVYQEWKLNLTGAVNAQTTQKIGEMTGASYLLIGSVQKMGGREILFFAKLVGTESAEIRQAANVSIKADEEVLLLNRPVETGEETKDDAVILSKKGEKDCVWVESPGVVRFGVDETKNQARARAIVRARQKAMMAVLGEEVGQQFSNFGETAFKKETSLIENILLLTRYGKISEEKMIEEGLADSKDCKGCRYKVLVQDCITPQRKEIDKGFQVSLNLNRTEFKEGEEAQAIVNVTRDAYIYLISVDKDWNQVVAFPNQIVQENFLKANELFIYPDDTHKKRGIHLVAELPKETEFSAETLRVLATKQQFPETWFKEKYNQLLEKLDQAGMDWCESTSAFTIKKK